MERGSQLIRDVSSLTGRDGGGDSLSLSDVEELLQSTSPFLLAEGTFTTSSATVPADTARAEANDYWKGCWLMATAGAIIYQPRLISGFANTGGVFTLDVKQPFTAVPGLVTYVILGPTSEIQPGASRQVFESDGVQATVVVNATAGDKSMPSISVTIQANRTVDRVTAAFAWRKQVNSSGSANAVNVAQHIQVRSDAPGCWVNAIGIADNSLSTAASATEGGMMIMGSDDIKGEVAATDIYEFQWDNADVDGASLTFHDVQTYIIVEYI